MDHYGWRLQTFSVTALASSLATKNLRLTREASAANHPENSNADQLLKLLLIKDGYAERFGLVVF